MKKRWKQAAVVLLAAILLLVGGIHTSDGQESFGASEAQKQPAGLADGVYTAVFTTDSAMFRVNEAKEERGILTVADGEMTIHVSLASKNIVRLYAGLAADAKKAGALLLEPTVDTITYADGWTDEVYGFDIPVPALDVEFDVALIGKKGKWYDHKVCVSAPERLDAPAAGAKAALADGTYTIEVTLEGGSGRAQLVSPVKLYVSGQTMTAALVWDSPSYDYMRVDGKTYMPLSPQETKNFETSVFELPVAALDVPLVVVADTVAMSTPHEIDYTLTFHSDTLKPAETALVYESSMELSYAENFAVDYYEGGYTMLTTKLDGRQFLLVPQGQEVPAVAEDVTVLEQPVQNVYLVASAIMDMFCALDGLDAVAFSGQKSENWYIEPAREAMEGGTLRYAGKYSKPDYELLVSQGCGLAIENQMISHAPEVIEKLEDFQIPVMIEYSSAEAHPLGRVEWVKFFGALLGKEAEAEQLFDAQTAILDEVTTEQATNQTVAFFFVTSNGLVQVRQPSDYVPKLIELAGGSYAFSQLRTQTGKRSTLNLQVEEFYQGAKDADVLIYNSSIDGGVSKLEELFDKCPLLADCKAVKQGAVWCTTNDLYQQSLSIGYLLEDLHALLSGADEAQMHYLFRLK